ncbi:glucan endo-1,3-beta-glucosidase-like [Cryptomeria japonica]|uniref:glucan endo-1,3-beta-glucosidase-like n=1 Tax=Cryptomeria japonica TaxID=3369 RepID=UPI0027DA51E7|nr:glucan endo-1,3-beta-glucosidase-like [Cryptomeria japonica]XP_059070293.1 glucan endo-1,3-beta-glucosidase-like [Cryptomeria japonica]
MEVLRLAGISHIYKMRTMNLLHAQQLFCWNAFLQPSPPEGFEDLVEKFLHVCNGLPLSLKVIGEQLYGSSRKDYWESQLHKISRILPNCITERLKVSYDALDKEEKHTFLETACFFVGKEKNSAIAIWNRLGRSGLHSLETLVNKSLVEIDEDNYIRMHDHLRDLGREIAYEQSPYTLCFPRQLINAEKQAETGTRRIGETITAAAPTSQVDDFPVSSQILLPEKIGVNNGLMGDNLPPAEEVVTLMKNNNIGSLRIYKAEPLLLRAFANSGIDIIVGVANFELQSISSNQEVANKWVDDNVLAFYPATNIKYIVVGNQALEKSEYGQYVLPAMSNLQTSLQNTNLHHNIKVSTTHGRAVIPMSYLPSKGAFNHGVKDKMRSVLQFLDHHRSPYMANIYPYFAFLENANISLPYALFNPTSPVLRDGDRTYTNLFDSMVDTIYSAMEALGFNNIPIVVTETGWPSQGTAEKALVATIDNAQTYNNNLVKHVLSKAGTPKKPGRNIETCIFALFNENMKAGDETERHFGLFHPNKQPVYPLHFAN